MGYELPNPKLRQRVRELAESQWRESVVVVYLDKVRPEFDVSGRRYDGTVKGKRLIRRFFWNILRGMLGVVFFPVLFLLVGDAGSPGPFRYWFVNLSGEVTGPENAQALGLVDAAKSAKALWLVHSASHVAVFDSGGTFLGPTGGPPPKILWHAEKSHAPVVRPFGLRLVWPDGSKFKYVISPGERILLKKAHSDVGGDQSADDTRENLDM
jgi:hypothetical protein